MRSALCNSSYTSGDVRRMDYRRFKGRRGMAETEIILEKYRLKVALIQPQIAPNTGNIARLCVATGTELHLVRPLGFVLSDRNLKRSAMDYWPRLRLTVHDETEAFFRAVGDAPRWLLTSKGDRSIWDADFRD